MQRKPQRGLRRGLIAFGGFALFAATLYAPSAGAAPIAPDPLVGTPGAEWSANTTSHITDVVTAQTSDEVLGSLVEQVLGLLGGSNSVANAELVTTLAEANSTGPVQGNDALRSYAEFANVGTVALLGGNDVDLVKFSQSAPPDNPTPQDGAFDPISVPGLANVELLPGTASARWAGDNACVAADTPVAQSHSAVANLDLLNQTVNLENQGQGAVDVTSTISLPSNPSGAGRDPRSVVGTTTAQVASIDALEGLLHIGVASIPTLTATATGVAGGASLDYSDPLLTVAIGGGEPQAVVSGQDLLGALGPVVTGLNALLALLAPLGTNSLTLTTGIVPGTEEESADGTHAAGDADLLHLNLTLGGLTVIDFAVLPMHAEANAPLGGLDCGGNNPITITKDASTPTVSPGDTFDYIITVGNISDPACTLSDIDVVDNIEGPTGSTIVATSPEATSAEWPNVQWTGLGPLEAGQTLQLRVTIKVPTTAANGDTYTDHAATDGVCGGSRTPTARFDLPDIPKIVIGTLPRTGGGNSIVVLLGVAGLLSAAVALRRLRRA